MGPAIVTVNSDAPIRILIVDRHEAVRRALSIRLNVPNHLEVVGVVESPAAAAEHVETGRPDVILLGLHSATDQELFGVANAVREMSCASAVVIVLAPYADAVEREVLLDAGAKRYLLKHINSNQLIREIESVAPRPANV
jgi:DNA-binding NarL/FixJ family response regulator